jgi:hypothetical protein
MVVEFKMETWKIVIKNKKRSFEPDISCWWSWKVEIMDFFNKQIRERMDGANVKDLQALHGVVGAAKYRNFIQFEGFDFLAELEEFDAVVKTIMDVGPVNLEYLCWLFVLESGGSAVALWKQICTILCKQKPRKENLQQKVLQQYHLVIQLHLETMRYWS